MIFEYKKSSDQIDQSFTNQTFQHIYKYCLANSIKHLPIEIPLPISCGDKEPNSVFLIVRPDENDRNLIKIMLSEIYVDLLTTEQLQYLADNVQSILSKNNIIGRLYLYGIRHGLKSSLKDYMFYAVRPLCDMSKWESTKDVKRCLKKAEQNIVFSADKISYGTYLSCLQLAESSDYAHFKIDDLEGNDLRNRWNYTSDENNIIITAWLNGQIIGFMMGCLVEGKSYMLQHYYNPRLKEYRVSDGLYGRYIVECSKRGINFIDWGTCDIYDKGLIKMKKKYSTKLKLLPISVSNL